MSFDTSKARAAILQRIRTNQRRPGPATDAERAQAEDYMARHPSGPRPAISGDLTRHFRQMAERMASTVDEVPSMAEAPGAVARYLAAQGLAPKVVVWPQLAGLDWAAAGVDAEARRPKRDESQGADPVGVTGCFCALAETGTLVLTSSRETPSSTHLLPETHIAIVPASRIVATMEDAFALMRAERGGVAQHDAARDQHGVRPVTDRRHRADHRPGRARAVPGAHRRRNSRLTTRSGARETASCRHGDGQPSGCVVRGTRDGGGRGGSFAGPTIAGIPVEFILFAATLAGVALFHHHTMPIAVGGATIIALYKIALSPFRTGAGFAGFFVHLGHEWVMLANLFMLLLGFALLAAHFEESQVPAMLPRLPARTTGRAASCCSCWSSCCRASSTTSPPR